MRSKIIIFFKVVRKIFSLIRDGFNNIICSFLFYIKGVDSKNFKTNGLPYISIALGGKCTIDSNFRMNNGLVGNPIGRPQKCVFFVDKGGFLKIGKDVGMSQTALVCYEKIIIGDYVKIGGGVCIYDTDFHSLDPEKRKDPLLDTANKVTSPVIICENAFIGAHSTILKGVTIGKNSIIGAGSIVTKDVPDNEIWGGNPAKKIKNIQFSVLS